MDKKDMVKRLYEKGILPSPGELEKVSEEKLGIILKNREEPQVAINPNREGVSVSLKKQGRKKKLSTQDVIDYYNRKYEKIRAMLLKKMDVVSITNAKTDPSPCSIIGIVKGMTQAGFIFEDPTGELEVLKSGIGELDNVGLDDIFGLKGFVRENRFFPKEIVWPDIPLNHRIGRIKGMDITLSKTIRQGMEMGLGFVVSESKPKNGVQITQNPEWITISRGDENVTILAFKTANTKRDDALFYLKRRSLPEPNPIKTAEPLYIIGEIPDIIWFIQDDEWTENHKGITIVSCGGKSLARINLETRAVKFMKL